MPLNPFFDPKVILELIKKFFEDTTKTILLLALVALGFLFTLLNRNQENTMSIYKKGWDKCETINEIQDIKIERLTESNAKKDSTLNRILGRLEAIEELKKNNHEISSIPTAARILQQ